MKWLLPLTLLISAVNSFEYSIVKTNDVTCSRPSRKSDKITVHYEGYFVDGSKFDSTFDEGKPITFPLGVGRVIKGWDEGFMNMCVGETRNLSIPADLGFGARGAGPVPPNSDLFYKIEMVSIEGVEKEEPERDEL